jgi:hypothetical protein
VLDLGVLLGLPDAPGDAVPPEVCWQYWLADRWSNPCSLLRGDQLDGAVLGLAGSSILHPASHEYGGPSVVGLFLLKAMEPLLKLDDLLRLPVKALLPERLLLPGVRDLDLGPSSLRADLEEVRAGALGV